MKRSVARCVWGLVAGLAAGVAHAAPVEGGGLSLPASASALWSRWQLRVSIDPALPPWRVLPGTAGDSGLKLRRVNVMGDYFFSTPGPGQRQGESGAASGFRATSGLMIGPRATLSLTEPPLDAQAVPYVGIGYSGAPAKGGWSAGWNFSADLGVTAQSPGSAVKLGRAPGTTPSLDDMLRDLRLSPVLQLGASYSF